MHRFRLLVVVCVLSFLIAGCGGAAPATSAPPAATSGSAGVSGQAPKVTNAPAATPLPAAATATRPATAVPAVATATTAAPKPTAAPTVDSITLQNRGTGLDSLKSYSMRWQAEWSGKDSTGKVEAGKWDWIEEYTASPEAQHVIWNMPDPKDATKSTKWETWDIGGMTYMKMGSTDDKDCMSFTKAESDSIKKGLFDPSMLGSVSGARFVGLDTVNGVAAKRYAYDENAARLSGFGTVKGEMWVAIDGGYVVKDSVAWKGGAGLFFGSTGDTGDGKWTWELSKINQPITIQAPAGCTVEDLGFPIMADATDKTNFSGSLMYDSPSSVDVVLAFYKQELSKAGWTVEEAPFMDKDGGMQPFKKGGETITVMLSKESDGTSVMVSKSK